MNRYKLTGRGWALAVVGAALVFLGAFALVSSAFGDGLIYGDPTPSDDSHLAQPSPTPPESPAPSDEPPTPEPSPTPDPTPEPSPTPVPSPIPSPSPPPLAPSEAPSPTPAPDPSPASSPAPSPAAPSPSPAPPPSEPDWIGDRVSIMFLFDSAEMAEPEQYYSDLADLLPPAADLAKAGYIVVVQAYFASDETSDDLAQRRAGAVSGMIRELGIPDASIRPHAATASGGAERYRQRADVYFLHVDSK